MVMPKNILSIEMFVHVLYDMSEQTVKMEKTRSLL
jgi:hypothetical protein